MKPVSLTLSLSALVPDSALPPPSLESSRERARGPFVEYLDTPSAAPPSPSGRGSG